MNYEQKRTTNKYDDPILEIRRDAEFGNETLVMRGNQSAKWIEINVKEDDGSFSLITKPVSYTHLTLPTNREV